MLNSTLFIVWSSRLRLHHSHAECEMHLKAKSISSRCSELSKHNFQWVFWCFCLLRNTQQCSLLSTNHWCSRKHYIEQWKEFLLKLKADRTEYYQDLLQNKLISLNVSAFPIKATGFREVCYQSGKHKQTFIMEALKILSLLFFVQVSTALPAGNWKF